jgi:DNA-binding transcriptional LysR family regulator
MDRFRGISAFVAVVEAGSFVGAAESLGSSKAAMSRAVLDLEARIGARLLHRTTRRLSLTEDGRGYYEHCRQALDELASADAEVAHASSAAVGLIRVNAPHSFGAIHLSSRWSAFLDAHPGVRLDVTLSDRLVDLVDEGFDMAIRIARLQDSSLVSRRLAGARMVMCATPGYLASRGTPQRLEDVAQHEVISYTYWSGGDTWRFSTDSGEREVATRPRLRANSGDTCRAVALSHGGIVLQPSFLVGEDLAAGRLVEILPQYHGPQLNIYAVYPTRRQLPARVRILIDFLADSFGRPGW